MSAYVGNVLKFVLSFVVVGALAAALGSLGLLPDFGADKSAGVAAFNLSNILSVFLYMGMLSLVSLACSAFEGIFKLFRRQIELSGHSWRFGSALLISVAVMLLIYAATKGRVTDDTSTIAALVCQAAFALYFLAQYVRKISRDFNLPVVAGAGVAIVVIALTAADLLGFVVLHIILFGLNLNLNFNFRFPPS